jgi:hypothetical protein
MKITGNRLCVTVCGVAGIVSACWGDEAAWVRPDLTEPNRVVMSGAWGDAYSRGLSRIGSAPYEASFVLSDVSFQTNRWFTNYSGDISGRFLELASLSSSRDNPQPEALKTVLLQIAKYQKADGHFGADVDWKNPEALKGAEWDNKVMPLMWGNGRLLLGLTAAASRFSDPVLRAAAEKLGDFYATTVVGLFCDPARREYYTQATGYASAYVTCVFEGMEGLVQLYRLTGEKRYLDTVRRMADFHEQFDTLPVNHSHGSLSEHEALILLYEFTGDVRYLNRVVARWDRIVHEGYVSPVGGVLEKFVVTGFDRDEGCSEADWLRLNLMLWRNTGQSRYLDMVERTMFTEMAANQWPDGGFGHRNFGVDATGPYAFWDYSQEALWCCAFHGPLALRELKSCLATGAKGAIELQFPVSFEAPVAVGKAHWLVKSEALPEQPGVPVRCDVTLTQVSAKGTAKAQEQEKGKGKGKVSLWVRTPEWASYVTAKVNGKPEPLALARQGYVKTQPLAAGTTIQLSYAAQPYLENRRLQRVALPQNLPARVENVVVRYGPQVLVNDGSGDIQAVSLKVDASGVLRLPGAEAATRLVPWSKVTNPSGKHAFVIHANLESSR